MPNTDDTIAKNPVKSLTKGYVLALLIIAAMSVTIHVIMDRILVEQDLAATVVSRSSAETTQIFKIATLITEHHHTASKDVLYDIEAENNTLKNIHDSLIQSAQEDSSKAGVSHMIKTIYFESPTPLSKEVETFIDNVDRYIEYANANGQSDAALYGVIKRQYSGSLTHNLSSSLVLYDNAFLVKVERLRAVQIAAIMVICITLLLEAFAIFMPLVHRVKRYAERLNEISMTDMLTGIGNRRYFVKRATQEIRRATRLDKELCICMVDIDHFKGVNDTHGHAAGDYVLREVTEIIKSAIRIEDDVARIGGEEFVVLLPASDIENALIVAERVRKRLEERPFVLPESNETIKVTASFGLAQINLAEQENIEAAISRADEALYASKENGRNIIHYMRYCGEEIQKVVMPFKNSAATNNNVTPINKPAE